MKILQQYILKNYSQIFFPIFLTLFSITSIVFLVKIASLTSVIQINFIELLLLYSFTVPTILFYTLPITIFISLSLTLSKLSSEYELIVITSFGLNPIKVIKLILPNILLSTILLLTISLGLMPKADYLKDIFINEKKRDAQFNIKASEYGQEFGDWLIYVGKENRGIYENIVLYQKTKDKDTFITARKAKMKNEDLYLSLILEDGKVININDNINQIDFKVMTINNNIKDISNINSLTDLWKYWNDLSKKSREADLSAFTLNSLLPLLSIFFILYIGYFNPRYQKNHSVSISLFLAVFFIILNNKLSKSIGLETLYIIPPIWVFISYILYRYKTKIYY